MESRDESSKGGMGSALKADGEAHLVFRVGALRFAIPSHTIDQLHSPQPPTPVPLGPSYLMGIANLRGEVVPLIDLQKFLGIQGEDSSRRAETFERVVVVAVGGMKVGIVCDEARGIKALGEEREVRLTKGEMIERVATAEVSDDEGVLVVLNVPKLLEEAQVKG